MYISFCIGWIFNTNGLQIKSFLPFLFLFFLLSISPSFYLPIKSVFLFRQGLHNTNICGLRCFHRQNSGAGSKEPHANAGETWVRSLGQEDPLEEGMATHSSILAWRIPRTEEPGGLQSMGSQRVRHDWATYTIILWWHKYFSVPEWLQNPELYKRVWILIFCIRGIISLLSILVFSSVKWV